MKTIFCGIVSLVLVGCATPEPLLRQTPSGQPEGFFPGRSVESVRDDFAALCVKAGMQVETAQGAALCSAPMKGSEAALTQILIGNSYSTTPEQKLRIQTTPMNGGVKVVVYAWVETQMAFGQVRKAPLNNPQLLNKIQQGLYSMGAQD